MLGISITVGMDSLCLLMVGRIISAIYISSSFLHPYKLVNNNNSNIGSLNEAGEDILNLLSLGVYRIIKFAIEVTLIDNIVVASVSLGNLADSNEQKSSNSILQQ